MDEMLYRLNAYDKNFDLMRDPLPDSVVIPFLDPVQRSRAVLQGRTSDQVDALLQSLKPYLDQGGENLFDGNRLETSAQGYTISRVKALKYASEHMQLAP